jgi:Mce-associated membrane protein
MSTSTNVVRARAGNPIASIWRSPRGMTMLVAVLSVLLVGSLSVGTAFGWHWYQDRADEQARNAAVSAAKVTVSDFMSVSAETVDRDLKRALNGTTGDLHQQYQNGMSKTRAAIVENKVSARAQVLWASVTTSQRKSATVLVAMDATIKNVNAPNGRKAHYRVQVTVAQQHGRWLVSALNFV